MSAEVKVSLAEMVLLPGEGAALERQEPGVQGCVTATCMWAEKARPGYRALQAAAWVYRERSAEQKCSGTILSADKPALPSVWSDLHMRQKQEDV